MFANNLPINSIILFESKKLIAITNSEIKSISLEIQCKKYKNHAHSRIPSENHENHENFRNPYENKANHENHRSRNDNK